MSASLAPVTPSLIHLITFLTRPLAVSGDYPSTTILTLQFVLQANLSPFFSKIAFLPFTFTLSSSCLPPPSIYSACIASGIAWSDWISLFGVGRMDLHFFVTREFIKVGLTKDMSSVITLWESTNDVEDSEVVPSIARYNKSTMETEVDRSLRLQETLDSVRARRSSPVSSSVASDISAYINGAIDEVKEIKIPSLLPSLTHPSAISPPAEDIDSFSDSDSESTTESIFSSVSSNSSMTSAHSSPVEMKVPVVTGFPRVRLAPSSPQTKPQVTAAAPKQSVRLTPRSGHARMPASVNNAKKPEVMKYLYQGGCTGVITGGVMLGGNERSTPSRRFTASSDSENSDVPFTARRAGSGMRAIKRPTVLLGPDADSWRVRV